MRMVAGDTDSGSTAARNLEPTGSPVAMNRSMIAERICSFLSESSKVSLPHPDCLISTLNARVLTLLIIYIIFGGLSSDFFCF